MTLSINIQIDLLAAGENTRSWEPFFVEQVPNITVPAGKDATLSCQVDNLHGYKVSYYMLLVFCEALKLT